MINYPHQIKAAARLIDEMGGRGILADEVGLGKTVEAGIAVFELIYRGQANSVLILAPAALVDQWRREMRDKFGLTFTVNPRSGEWLEAERIIASIDLAKREENRRLLMLRHFDILIVDEAHRLKNANSRNHALVSSLRSRYTILITATPIQNQLGELYNILKLVKPELVGSYELFQEKYVIDKRTPKEAISLKNLVSRVAIRHQKDEVAAQLPGREVEMVPLCMGGDEYLLYRSVVEFVRGEYRSRLKRHVNVLPLIALQREACSSARAVERTLRQMNLVQGAEAIREFASAIGEKGENEKSRRLLSLVSGMQDKVMVFTEFRATQELLRELLEDAGISVTLLNGSMSPAEKALSCERFRNDCQVMISTECGDEGLNLQFCSCLVNYDLPWNPMKVEQRIGRLHRVGQVRDVRIYNLFHTGTIEEHVVHLLHEKINLFRRVVGGLDAILSRFEEGARIERRVMDIIASSCDDIEMRERFDELGNEISQLLSGHPCFPLPNCRK